MKITSIRVKKLTNKGILLGSADVVLDDCLVIHGIRILEKNGKQILGFPNKKTKRVIMENEQFSSLDSFMDIVHPINSEFRKYMEDEILKVYNSENN